MFPGNIPINPFIVSGHLENSPIGRTVRVTVVETSEYRETLTDSEGNYLIDIGDFDIALTTGDTVTVSSTTFQSVSDTYSPLGFGLDINLLQNVYFVTLTGDDAALGTTWETAWKTIDKAASTLTDGEVLHIESGTYNAEPVPGKIFPVNIGPVGISYYVWGIKGTGKNNGTGVGSVIINTPEFGSVSFGTFTAFDTTGSVYPIASTKLDDTHWFLMYSIQVTPTPYYYYGVVATLSGGTISYGSKYVINTVSYYDVAISALDPTHVVIAYRIGPSPWLGKVKIATISGTTISYGSEQVALNANMNNPKIVTIDSSHFLLTYSDGGNGYQVTYKHGTVSGGIVTWGSPIFITGGTYPLSMSMIDISTFVSTYNDGSDYGLAICGSISGTTITFGTPVSFSGTNMSYEAYSIPLDTSRILLVYDDYTDSEILYAKIMNITGTTINSFGTVDTISSNPTWDIYAAHITGDTALVIYYESVGGIYHGVKLTVDGSLIAGQSEVVDILPTISRLSLIILTNSIGILSIVDSTSSYHGYESIISIS